MLSVKSIASVFSDLSLLFRARRETDARCLSLSDMMHKSLLMTIVYWQAPIDKPSVRLRFIGIMPNLALHFNSEVIEHAARSYAFSKDQLTYCLAVSTFIMHIQNQLINIELSMEEENDVVIDTRFDRYTKRYYPNKLAAMLDNYDEAIGMWFRTNCLTPEELAKHCDFEGQAIIEGRVQYYPTLPKPVDDISNLTIKRELICNGLKTGAVNIMAILIGGIETEEQWMEARILYPTAEQFIPVPLEQAGAQYCMVFSSGTHIEEVRRKIARMGYDGNNNPYVGVKEVNTLFYNEFNDQRSHYGQHLDRHVLDVTASRMANITHKCLVHKVRESAFEKLQMIYHIAYEAAMETKVMDEGRFVRITTPLFKVEFANYMAIKLESAYQVVFGLTTGFVGYTTGPHAVDRITLGTVTLYLYPMAWEREIHSRMLNIFRGTMVFHETWYSIAYGVLKLYGSDASSRYQRQMAFMPIDEDEEYEEEPDTPSEYGFGSGAYVEA